MNILILSHYFWPENFKINDLASNLNKKNNVFVLTGNPSYPKKEIFNKVDKRKIDKFKNIEIIRVPVIPRGKSKVSILFNYISFLLSLSIIGTIKILKKKIDVLLVFGTSPPTVMIPAIIISKIKKAKVIFWVLDLWPETLISMKIITNKFLLNIIKVYVSYIYNFSDLVFAQSNEFVKQIKKYCKNKKKIIYFPTWSDLNYKKNISKSKFFKKDYFYVTFAGNIGDAQDFENIIKCIETLKNNHKIKFLIVGDGSKYLWLKEQIKKKKLNQNVILTGVLPKKKIPEILHKSDCLLITLKRGGIDKLTVPGKLSDYMIFRKPIVGMINGETHKIIKDTKCGFVCKSGDYKNLSKNINVLFKYSKNKRKNLGNKAFEFGKINFDRKKQFLKTQYYLNKLYCNIS